MNTPMKRLWFVMMLSVAMPASVFAQAENEALVQRMNEINAQLRGTQLHVAIEQIEFFTIGQGRPPARIHEAGLRWVPNDPRRTAEGDHITYLVDQSDGATASGLTSAQTVLGELHLHRR